LVAELLPSTESEFEWDDTNNLRFYYRYDFLPAGVITRFIVRVHQDIERRPDGTQLCWREGAVLQRENTRAFVKVKTFERLIEIKINGDKKRELLAIIRREFDQINSSIKKNKIAEEIPCICSKDCTYKFEYGKLLKAEKAGKDKVQCNDSWDDVQLSLLLDGYEKKENRIKHYDSNKTTIFTEVYMGDKYIAGQVGAQGPGAHAHDMKFNQIWSKASGGIDLSELAMELTELGLKLKEEATEPEHEFLIGAIASAERFAREKNGPKALEYLSKAGKWTLDIATQIGVPVATEALKKALGL
jgi:hypothetical protein